MEAFNFNDSEIEYHTADECEHLGGSMYSFDGEDYVSLDTSISLMKMVKFDVFLKYGCQYLKGKKQMEKRRVMITHMYTDSNGNHDIVNCMVEEGESLNDSIEQAICKREQEKQSKTDRISLTMCYNVVSDRDEELIDMLMNDCLDKMLTGEDEDSDECECEDVEAELSRRFSESVEIELETSFKESLGKMFAEEKNSAPVRLGLDELKALRADMEFECEKDKDTVSEESDDDGIVIMTI
jgi:hypothetical protein